MQSELAKIWDIANQGGNIEKMFEKRKKFNIGDSSFQIGVLNIYLRMNMNLTVVLNQAYISVGRVPCFR